MVIYTEVAGSQLETVVPKIFVDPNDPTQSCFYKKVRSFLDAVKEGGKAPVPTSQILYNQAIIDGIVKSAKIGKEIAIELPEV